MAKSQTVRERLQDILALLEDAEKRGEDGRGEADAARHMLEKLASKYKISVESLRSPVREFHRFSFKMKFESLLLMAIYMKVRESWDVPVKTPIGKSKTYLLELTEAEAIDVDVLYKFYRKAFAEECDSLMVAFVTKHDIRPKEGRKQRYKDELTDEELQRAEMLENMRNGMKRRDNPLGAGYLPIKI